MICNLIVSLFIYAEVPLGVWLVIGADDSVAVGFGFGFSFGFGVEVNVVVRGVKVVILMFVLF